MKAIYFGQLSGDKAIRSRQIKLINKASALQWRSGELVQRQLLKRLGVIAPEQHVSGFDTQIKLLLETRNKPNTPLGKVWHGLSVTLGELEKTGLSGQKLAVAIREFIDARLKKFHRRGHAWAKRKNMTKKQLSEWLAAKSYKAEAFLGAVRQAGNK
jgi:hypothetical protein